MMFEIIQFVFIALAVSAASLTLTKAQISAPFRHWVKTRNKWLGELVSCPYCASHWLALGATLLYRPTIVSAWWPIDLITTVLATVALAALVTGVVYRSMA